MRKLVITALLFAAVGCSHSKPAAKPTRDGCPSCNAPAPQSAFDFGMDRFKEPGCKNGKCPIPKQQPKAKGLSKEV